VLLTEETHDSKQPLLGEDDHTHTGHMVPPDGQHAGSGGLFCVERPVTPPATLSFSLSVSARPLCLN
jgi:hypothetical protein